MRLAEVALDHALGGAERDGVDRDVGGAGALRDLGRVLAVLARAVRQQHDRGRWRILVVGLQRLQRGVQRVAGRGAALGLQRGQRRLDRQAVLRRAQHRVRAVGEGHEADLQLLGHVLEEPVGGLLGRRQPVGLHVDGVHRAGGVGHEHHARPLHRHGDRGLGPRERDRHPGQRQHQQRGREVLAHAAVLGRDRGERRRRGEADHVLGRLAAAEPQRRERDRDDRQAGQEERCLETHRRLLPRARSQS